MRLFTLTQRLKILVSISIGVIILAAMLSGWFLIDQMRQAQKLQQRLLLIKQTSELIHNLQIEMALSGGFIESHGSKFAKELQYQRSYTNAVLVKSKSNVISSNAHHKLIQMRNYIDIKTFSSIESFDGYTALIGEMRSRYLAQVKTVRHFEMRNQLQAYTNLMATKEAMAQMRGVMNTLAAKNANDHLLFVRISHAKAEFDIAQGRFRVLALPEQCKHFESVLFSSDFAWTFHIINNYIGATNPNNFVNPELWFIRSTSVINQLYTLEEEYFASFDTIVNQELETSQTVLIYGSIAVLILIVILLFFGNKISRIVETNIRLLDEYKQVVDRSSIVSKTNPKGIITYVNDQFCDISGYTRDELIGKSHNLLRHPDMHQEVFKEMWTAILNKQPWSGVVKNQKKDGTYYWVEAIINPILDNNGNIEEFIAVRNDITKTIHLHEELERTQEDMIMRIGEIGETRSLETGYHVRRVAEYSRILATKYGLSEQEIRYLTDASPMHDIGKIGIPDSILQKKGPLNDDEWAIMRIHSETGYHFFENSDSPLLKTAAIIAYEHHEKWDGSGYPRRLKGEEIHIYGRITALSDVFDALGSDRCYKKAWKNEQIYELIRREKGKHFDPILVDLFFEHIDEFTAVQSHYSEKSAFMKEANNIGC